MADPIYICDTATDGINLLVKEVIEEIKTELGDFKYDAKPGKYRNIDLRDKDILLTKQGWIMVYLLKGNDLYLRFPKKIRRSSTMRHYREFRRARVMKFDNKILWERMLREEKNK